MPEPAPRAGSWASSPVRCLVCLYVWVAVRPAPTLRLECPRCHRMSGAVDTEVIRATR